MHFEWDPRKALENERKHQIAFEAALTAFDDPFALIAPDPAHSTAREVREWLIGEADRGVVVIVFTRRNNGTVFRIISARPGSRKERSKYEAYKRISL